MLKLKKRLQFPQLSNLGSKQLALSPVVNEDDELIVDEEQQAQIRDDRWTLEATPDTEKLQHDWEEITEDIRHDPEWISFSDDD